MYQHPDPHRPDTTTDTGTTGQAGVEDVSDAELVERYQQHRDTDAFTIVVSRYQRRLWATAARMLRNPQDASDVVQSAWLNALRALARPGGFDHRASVSTWLHRIVRNEAVDRLRRNQVRAHQSLDEHSGRMDDNGGPAAPGDAFAAADARLVLAELLDGLAPAQREAIELVWLRGLSVDEAAAVLGVATGTVKSRCGRARQQMAAAVARAGLITTALHHDPPPA